MQTAWSPVGRDAGNSTPRWESQPPSRSLHTPAPGRQNKRCCWRDRRVSGRRTRPMDQPIAQVKPPWDEKGVHFPLRHTLRPPHAPVASRLFPPLPRLPPLAQRSIPHDPRHEPPEHHIEPRMLPSRTGGSPEVAWARGHNKNARWANARAFPRPCSLRTAGARILSAAHPLAWPLAPSGVAGMCVGGWPGVSTVRVRGGSQAVTAEEARRLGVDESRPRRPAGCRDLFGSNPLAAPRPRPAEATAGQAITQEGEGTWYHHAHLPTTPARSNMLRCRSWCGASGGAWRCTGSARAGGAGVGE